MNATISKMERIEMKTSHELLDGIEADLLGAFLNTVDENTTLGDAFLAGVTAGKETAMIAGVDADLHSPSLFTDGLPYDQEK